MSMREGIVTAAVALLLTALVQAPAQAQLRPGSQPAAERVSRTMVMVGGSQLDIEALNTRLEGAGYPTFDDRFFAMGLNFARYRGPVVLGLEVGGLTRPSRSTEDFQYSTSLNAGYLLLNVGYAIVQEGALELVPKAGLGFGSVVLGITDQGTPTFDDVLADPGRSTSMATASLLLDGSLGMTYRLGARAPRVVRGLALGARVGYTQSLLHSEWTRDLSNAPGGPDAGWGGPHVEFMIGRWTGR
jgi:hypothetical protein